MTDQHEDDAGDAPEQRVRLTVSLHPEDEGLLRAIAIGQGLDATDGAAAIVGLIREDSRRRGLGFIVNQRVATDPRTAAQKTADGRHAHAVYRARAQAAKIERATAREDAA